MNIHAYILCYNEEKMIRHTMNHYSKFCTQITVLNSGSTDSSMEILKNEYPNVIIKDLPGSYQDQLDDIANSDLKNSIWKGSNADYVIVCDMDEFLYHPKLNEALAKCKRKRCALPMVAGYNMFSHDFPDDYSRPIIDQIKNGVRAYNFDKQIIFDPNQISQINYHPGAHKCFPKYAPGANIDICDISFDLLHYKYINIDYLIKRHELFAARLSEFNIKHGYGAEYNKGADHIHECFRLIENSGRIVKVVE